ncbi:MAG: plasmid recombination protein [Epibacterium sp.]|nr:plasmid recombination protein [Epibacterium sp.]NQX74653.1 plasmid recombination protein [Epibacterium sp.]
MTKLVLNIERVGWSKLEGQRRHDQRIGGDLSHVDLEASEDNLVLHGSGDAKADVRACLDKFGAAPRADNETPFNRFVIQPGDGFDWSDGAAIGKWLGDSKKWLQDEYGDGFVYAVVHTDERTPHIHAVCVPLYQSKTKHREAWKVSHKQHPATKGKGSYERLRQRCADALGFEYGEPGNKPRTEAQRLADEAAEAIKAKAKAEALGIVSKAHIEAHGMIAEAKRRGGKILADVHEKIRVITPGIDIVLREMSKRPDTPKKAQEQAAVVKTQKAANDLTLREFGSARSQQRKQAKKRFLE